LETVGDGKDIVIILRNIDSSSDLSDDLKKHGITQSCHPIIKPGRL
jgi:hypothetical protein